MDVWTLNVGDDDRERAPDITERRKTDILCMQDARWKVRKARSIESGFKLFYHSAERKREGKGIILKEQY